MSRSSAYLDHAAASPLDPRVREAMRPFYEADLGSPDSLHEWGRRPAEALERARSQVAALAGVEPEEVLFTSGPTEARNLAVKGLLAANRRLGTAVVASAVEHPATLAACRSAERAGAELRLVGVDEMGRIDHDALEAALDDDVALVSVVHAQPDLGTLQDVAALAALVRARRPEARVHVDAGESAGLVPVQRDAMDADALTLGGGSIGAPAWTGALAVRPAARLHPLIEGGLQEAGKRAGAVALPGVVGLGAAAEIAAAEMARRAARMRALSDRLLAGLLAVPGVRLNGPPVGPERLPGHVQVSVGDVEGETLALRLAAVGVACSPGSACTAHAGKAAPALEAIGLEPPWTHSAVLFTLRASTGEDEVDRAVAAFAAAVASLRAMSPLAR